MSTPPSQDETATKILLVIDVQSCLFRGPNALPEAPALTEKISDVLARARGTKGRVKIIYIRHNDASDPDFTPNTPAWEIHEPFRPVGDKEPIVDKTVPSAFHETRLKRVIDDLAPGQQQQQQRRLEIICVGVQSDYCIRATSLAAREVYPEARVGVVRGAHGTYGIEETGESAREVARRIEREVEGKGVVLLEGSGTELGF